jgi:hypothetical protein
MHARTKIFTASATASLLLVSARAIDAHHSPTMFDTSKAVTISGTIVRFDAVNPHSLMYVELESSEGPVQWAVEGPGPNQLARRGIAEGALTPGATVEACGYVLKDPQTSTGRSLLVAEVVVMPDGQARLWSDYGNRHCRDENGYEI